MSSNARRRNVLWMLSIAAAVLGFGTGRANAQFGFGGFGGGGFGIGFGFNNVPQPGTFINSKALIDAGRDTHIPSRDVYANNPNSYINEFPKTFLAWLQEQANTIKGKQGAPPKA